jgi:hypothetical protein
MTFTRQTLYRLAHVFRALFLLQPQIIEIFDLQLDTCTAEEDLGSCISKREGESTPTGTGTSDECKAGRPVGVQIVCHWQVFALFSLPEQLQLLLLHIKRLPSAGSFHLPTKSSSKLAIRYVAN